MIKNSSSQDKGHSESPKVASENTLREQIVQARYDKYDTYASLSPDEQETIDRIMQAFTAAVETVIGETPPYNPETMHKRNWHAQGNLRVQQLYRLAEMVGKTRKGENEMDEQDNRTHVSEIKLNELMLRLGFHWVEPDLWVKDGDIKHNDAIEVLRLYEEDR